MSHELEVIWMRARDWHESASAPRQFTDEFKEKVRCQDDLDETSPSMRGSNSTEPEPPGPSREEMPHH